MSVKFSDNTAKIIFEHDNSTSLAIRYMLDAIETTAFPKTPKRDGNLRKDILKQVLGKKGIITWKKNYAVYQEKKQFVNYSTPGTGPHFAEGAVRKVTDNSAQYFRKARLI